MNYSEFLHTKVQVAPVSGFEVRRSDINPALKPHQKDAVMWAVKGGRRALFEAFGLGKTVQELEWCRLVQEHEQRPVIIVLPLGVRQEFTRDAQQLLGMEAPVYVRTMAEVMETQAKIYMTNYERVRDGDIDPNYFAGAALDEASVLRSYGSKTFQTFMDLFKGLKYKLVATATPSPNRYKELIHYAGYLEVMDTGQALTRFFQRDSAADKVEKRKELKERYPNCESVINFLCCCNSAGEPRPNIQLVINSSKYMRDFIAECPPDFQISAKCCDYCKKQLAHSVQKDYEMIITGERRAEGGMRSVPRKDNTSLCFTETSSGQYRLRPLYYVTDADKEWYRNYYGIRYSDAYEVYGLTRTGCSGCPISYKAVDDLEKIRPYEPNVVKAAYNIFGKSYAYREKYNAYKKHRMEDERKKVGCPQLDGQMEMVGI